MNNQLATCLFAFAAACTSAGVESDPITQGANPGSDSGICAEPEGPIHNYTTAAEVDGLVVGQWVRCSGPDLLPSPQDGGVGIEFDSDGTYYVLASGDGSGSGSGGLVKQTGFNNQGTWVAELPPDSPVMFLTMASGGTLSFQPTFEDSPAKFAVGDIATGIDSESIYASTH